MGMALRILHNGTPILAARQERKGSQRDYSTKLRGVDLASKQHIRPHGHDERIRVGVMKKAGQEKLIETAGAAQNDKANTVRSERIHYSVHLSFLRQGGIYSARLQLYLYRGEWT